MKWHKLITVTLITLNLSGCDNEPAPKEIEAQIDKPHEESQTWLKIPENWDYDQQLVKQHEQIEKIAKDDDYNIRGGGESTIIYPLREMAQDAIDTLKTTSPASTHQNYAEIRKHISQTPASAERTLKTLANYLIKPAKTQTERAYAIFYWLTQNIAYDTQSFFSGNYGDLTPAGVLRSRKAICSGYSRLFTGLAKQAKLEVVEIIGVSKSYGFSEKGTLGDHAWNAVKIDDQWRLLDATWGAGFVTKSGEFEKKA